MKMRPQKETCVSSVASRAAARTLWQPGLQRSKEEPQATLWMMSARQR
jgi:hypothetical protein